MHISLTFNNTRFYNVLESTALLFTQPAGMQSCENVVGRFVEQWVRLYLREGFKTQVIWPHYAGGSFYRWGFTCSSAVWTQVCQHVTLQYFYGLTLNIQNACYQQKTLFLFSIWFDTFKRNAIQVWVVWINIRTGFQFVISIVHIICDVWHVDWKLNRSSWFNVKLL